MAMTVISAIPPKPLAILHIEDDHGDALLVSKALASSGLDVASYTHRDRLSDGLAFLRSSRVDLILLDVNLPDAAVLRFDVVAVRRCSSAPILFVTGLEAAAIADTLQRGRTFAHLPKSELSAETIEAKIADLVMAPPAREKQPANGADHRFEAVLEAMSDPVLVLDSHGQVFWANEAGEGLIQDNPHQTWSDFFDHGRTVATSVTCALMREGQRRKFDARISELADRSVGSDLFVAVLRHELR
ncbi:PAS domain-containing protein [Hyphobacterium sp.]|uniref:PAS domain-containing protein n=1 Tax=Hyphobacterium sp. TaxID=2004662 RepID=UPI003B528272